ncbi:MAG: DUF5596 domain-containing protein [Lentisphaeria bacterium]|nr:DUF5596 domain-containing protein [Lentisphaeria bacterium]
MDIERLVNNARLARLPEFCVEALASLCATLRKNKQEEFYDLMVEKCTAHTLTDQEILDEFPEAEKADLFRMLVIVGMIDRAFETYREKNIPEEILLENLLDAPIWLEYHMENYSHPGFQWRIVEWCRTLWEGNVLKFGRLQLETAGVYKEEYNTYRTKEGKIVFASENEAGKEWECLLSKGDRIVSIHIPASGPLKKELCIESFRRMREYLAKYRPDIGYKAVRCSSWLLDPQLQQILPTHSNILAFQTLGHIRASGTFETETVGRVFGEKAKAEGINAVPHKTDMQKRLAAFAAEGGRFDNGVMFILKEEFDSLCDGKAVSVS